MIYIYDENNFLGDFGDNEMHSFIYDVAEENNLVFIKNFLDNGFTVDLLGIINEIERTDWPVIEGIDERMKDVLLSFLKAKGMVYLK